MSSGAQQMGGMAAGSRLVKSLAAGSQAPRGPDNDGAALEPKWLRTPTSHIKSKRKIEEPQRTSPWPRR